MKITAHDEELVFARQASRDPIMLTTPDSTGPMVERIPGKGGRPRKWRSDADRVRAVRARQRGGAEPPVLAVTLDDGDELAAAWERIRQLGDVLVSELVGRRALDPKDPCHLVDAEEQVTFVQVGRRLSSLARTRGQDHATLAHGARR